MKKVYDHFQSFKFIFQDSDAANSLFGRLQSLDWDKYIKLLESHLGYLTQDRSDPKEIKELGKIMENW